MYYLISFIITGVCILWLIGKGVGQRVSIMLLGVVMTIGNGGFLALSKATTLEEALLANKLCYFIGIFAPMLLFEIMCEICHFELKTIVVTFMAAVQGLLYVCVCTVGTNNFFYKSVELHIGENGSYLTKTYGPMHTVYLVSMAVYFVINIAVAVWSLSKKNFVNATNIEMILAADLITVLVYLVERFLRLEVELMPMAFSIGFIFNIGPMIKLHTFSIERNSVFLAEKFGDSAFIIFDKKLNFRGCNDYARKLFPELNEWKLEARIPGNGGRFNTYLRRPLLDYVKDENAAEKATESFAIKNEQFESVVRRMISDGNRHVGYTIEIRNITDYVVAEKNE